MRLGRDEPVHVSIAKVIPYALRVQFETITVVRLAPVRDGMARGVSERT